MSCSSRIAWRGRLPIRRSIPTGRGRAAGRGWPTGVCTAPRIYFSAYGQAFLQELAHALAATPADELWCIFDNTASGAAMTDTLLLQALLASGS
jgi:uncharacterized protein YecE (DUF72 family)